MSALVRDGALFAETPTDRRSTRTGETIELPEESLY